MTTTVLKDIQVCSRSIRVRVELLFDSSVLVCILVLTVKVSAAAASEADVMPNQESTVTIHPLAEL